MHNLLAYYIEHPPQTHSQFIYPCVYIGSGCIILGVLGLGVYALSVCVCV